MLSRMKEREQENRRVKKLRVETPIKADSVAAALAKKLCRHLADVRWPERAVQ